jgi:hypothetical protein
VEVIEVRGGGGVEGSTTVALPTRWGRLAYSLGRLKGKAGGLCLESKNEV